MHNIIIFTILGGLLLCLTAVSEALCWGKRGDRDPGKDGEGSSRMERQNCELVAWNLCKRDLGET